MSEKKKGFWSWLGFGKKTEQAVETEQKNAVEATEITEVAQHVHAEKSEELTAAAESVAKSTPVETTLATETLTETKTESVVEAIEAAAEASVQDSASVNTDDDEAEESNALPSFPEILPLEAKVIEDVQEEAEVAALTEERASEENAETEALTEVSIQTVDAVQVLETVEKIESEQAVLSEENVVNPTNENADVAEAEVEETTEEIAEEIETETDEKAEETQVSEDHYQEKPSRGGFFSRLIQGLVKTKQNIGSGFLSLFRGKKIDDDLFEELEEQLLIADLGMPTTTKIIKNLTQHASRAELRDAEQLYQKLKEELAAVLAPVSQPLVLEPKKPYVILMVGVNGVGKTTTIGKLARKFQAEGKSVMLAAGDTFRAAAVEQLQVWGERNHIPVVAQSTGADSASVIYDAMQSAAAKGIDVLIADTAGRLQNKNHLMDELKKIVRVMKKYDESAPHEIMLTLDAGTGQNAISQAKLFHEAVGLTGITLTKLDGTAKGGVIFAIADQFGLPIRYIGVGEKIEDLREFDATEFIEALFTQEEK